MGIKKFVLDNDLGIVLNNKRFKDVTTMKVGGRIKELFYPNNIENLLDVVSYLNKKKRKYLIIGNGSNIIASDNIYKDVVISGKHLVNDIIFKEDFFIVSAFDDLRKIIANLIGKDIATFINLSGIPATIGGALYMNAGAFKSNISDYLIWVECIYENKIIRLFKEDLEFGYRTSIFKNNKYIIVNAAFRIIYENNLILKYNEINNKRKEIHPLNYPNSGSIFKNTDNIKAYKIIKQIGLVDYMIGDATFSNKHANFIINKGNAKAKDIYKLIILAKKRAFVFEKIILEEEVILLNFFSYLFFKIIFKKSK
jgi:UDP-N-acetylmuramate dehydrogenase